MNVGDGNTVYGYLCTSLGIVFNLEVALLLIVVVCYIEFLIDRQVTTYLSSRNLLPACLPTYLSCAHKTIRTNLSTCTQCS